MTRIELTVALAAALLAAALTGWVLCWLWGRLARGGARDFAGHSDMAELLHAAKMERDAALERERETAARMAVERRAIEESLKARLAEREAELAATMDTLGDLRREVAEWRDAYETLLRREAD